MRIAVAQRCAIDNRGLIEQRSTRGFGFTETAEKSGQFPKLGFLDPPELFELFGLIAVICQRVRAGVDAGDIGLGIVLVDEN